MWTQKNQQGGTYVIAEAGVNHNGNPELAYQLVDVAVAAGADAVKFQTFFTENLVNQTSTRAAYQARNTRSEDTQFEMLKRLELPREAFAQLKTYCDEKDIEFLSTPFDEDAADFLDSIDVRGFKVSSGDLTHHAFLSHLAGKRKPVLLSTGMANLAEVAEAVDVLHNAEVVELALLHCVSDYPAAPEDCNLNAMGTLERCFNLPVGWSDHTEGDAIALAAVATGAKIIEKHFTLDKMMDGPDHAASLSPDELTALITKIRAVEIAFGDGVKRPTQKEMETPRRFPAFPCGQAMHRRR